MSVVFEKSSFLTDDVMHYCPGCTHGIAHRILAEVLEELDLKGRIVGVAPVGCSVFIYKYLNCDMQQASHGRASAVATGVKLNNPNNIVFAYQGDGDLASIGTAEIVHAAARGTNITVIFINNAIFGMTGGQMAPTTILGQKATTCIGGRTAEAHGHPIKICEMLATLDGPSYIERCSLVDVKRVLQAKKAIKKAFQNQIDGKGFSLIELLSTCPTNWKLSPQEAIDFVKGPLEEKFPLGVYKEI